MKTQKPFTSENTEMILMANIKIIGKPSSAAYKELCKAGNYWYNGQSGVDVVINYGLAWNRLIRTMAKYKNLKTTPIINRVIGLSKLTVIKLANKGGILVPESKVLLSSTDKIDEWIEKKINSAQGKGINKATKRTEILGKYYQKFVKDRVYELRVHAFTWLPKETWKVHRRIGPAEQIAWNWSRGGHFSSYSGNTSVANKAREISEQILKLTSIQFGAIDFIVDGKNNLYFIEINSCPGFTALSSNIYIRALDALTKLPAKIAKGFGRK